MKTLFALTASVTLCGCATLMHGNSQDVGIQSSPTGAIVTVDNQSTGQTPYVAHLSRKDNHIVKVALPGYAPAEMTVTRSTSGWVWGNVLFGGIPGLAIDAITGGLYKLGPEQLSATLVEIGSAPDALSVRTSAPPARQTTSQPRTTAAGHEPTLPAGLAPAPPSTLPDDLHAQANIGAPRSEADRQAAMQAFAEAQTYMGTHEWAMAEQSFQKAVLYDGSVAKYHAALGSLMMLLHRWVDATASYSAAVLLDVDNPDYRRALKEARSRR